MPRKPKVATLAPVAAPAPPAPPVKWGHNPPKWQSPEAFEAVLSDYFAQCDTADPPRPYTVTGLALHLGTSRKGLIDYSGTATTEAGYSPVSLAHTGPDAARYQNALARAKLRCEHWAEVKLLTSPTQVTGTIFSLKNNYGWRDEQHVQHSGGVTVQIGTPLHPVPAPEADWDGLVLEAERGEPKG